MPDQFKYWLAVNQIRSGEVGLFEALSDPGNVLQASAFLSLLPFPAPVSVISLEFYNTFLYIVLFLFCIKRKYSRVFQCGFIYYFLVWLYILA